MNEYLSAVTDSTDWLSTPISGLCAVEAALRCQVCKDFFKTPMLTSCNHTFCSICIRRAVSNDGKCPLCRAPEQELRLRSNWSMEEVVDAFTNTRAEVWTFTRQPHQVAHAVPPSPKRKPADILDVPPLETDEPGRKRLRSWARQSKTRDAEASAEAARLEAHTSPEREPDPIPVDDGLVQCPICKARLKEALINRHLDSGCEFLPPPPPSPPHSSFRASFPTMTKSPRPNRPDPLPALHYSMLKDAQLRKRLSELGISTAGTRPMLESRHREWVTIWNANCDSQHPRAAWDLKRDLDEWERTVGSRAPTTSRLASMGGAHVRDKGFDQAAWSNQHEGSFRHLVASARKNLGTARTTPMEASVATVDTWTESGATASPAPDRGTLSEAGAAEGPAPPVLPHTSGPPTPVNGGDATGPPTPVNGGDARPLPDAPEKMHLGTGETYGQGLEHAAPTRAIHVVDLTESTADLAS